MIPNFLNASLRLLLNPSCAACDSSLEHPLDGPVCPACWRSIAGLTPPCCDRCGDALASAAPPLCGRCQHHPPRFLCARSAGQYDGALRQIVHAFKYERRRALGQPLAALMSQAGADLLRQADALVPVPLHAWRHLARGFNQADDLAQRLGRPVCRVLRRRRHGPPQASLPAARRHNNVRHAFALRTTAGIANVRRLLNPRALVAGRVLVLVDDVMTTGATLDACAGVLLDAGARAVLALTAARAAAARPAPPLSRPDP